MIGGRRLFWKLYFRYLVISVTAVAALFSIAYLSFRSFYITQTARDLEARASLVVARLTSVDRESTQQLQSLVKELGHASETRITALAVDGSVLADSREDPSRMDNHLARIEIQEALKSGGVGRSVRFSGTVHEDSMYLALRVTQAPKGSPVAVVRVSVPLVSISSALRSLFLLFFLGTAFVVVVIAAVTWRVSLKITQPLEIIRSQARKISHGDFGSEMELMEGAPEEVVLLGEAIQSISTQLNQRIQTVTSQRNEIHAILSSMVEGLMAIDQKGLILHINQAAAEILEVDLDSATGKEARELLKNEVLIDFFQRVGEGLFPIESEVEILGTHLRSIQIHGAPLIGGQGERSGAVFVFNDITRLRQLENHRRDFVANVSHELRTPLTSIKGFVETLMEGALDDPATARKFLEIMSRHTNRLGAIIEDLLALSRLERDVDHLEIELRVEKLRPVLSSAVEICQSKARQKQIAIHIEEMEGLTAWMNPPLLEQAIINLVDNALKYSDSGKSIWISAKHDGEWVRVYVRDEGAGIAPEHLPRLFERFYRVDKARSRTMGGTGLGLAIVKHIAAAHQGQILVESTLGKGSTFEIQLHSRPSA